MVAAAAKRSGAGVIATASVRGALLIHVRAVLPDTRTVGAQAIGEVTDAAAAKGGPTASANIIAGTNTGHTAAGAAGAAIALAIGTAGSADPRTAGSTSPRTAGSIEPAGGGGPTRRGA